MPGALNKWTVLLLLPAVGGYAADILPSGAVSGEESGIVAESGGEEVEVITVTAAAESLKAGASAAAAWIDAEMIAASGAETAADALKLLPGVHVNSNGVSSSIGSVSLRGSRSNQVLILVDGVPMVDPGGSGGYDPFKIPADAVERIEVVKGGAAALYGDGAFAGAVNIVTKSGGNGGGARYFFNSQEGHRLSGDFSLTSKSDPTLSGGLSASVLYNPYDLKIVGGATVLDAVLGFLQANLSKETESLSVRFRSFVNESADWEDDGSRLSVLSQSNSLSWSLKNLGGGRSRYDGHFALNFYHMLWGPGGSAFDDESFSAVMLLKNGGRRAFDGERWRMKLTFGGDIKTELTQSYAVGFRHRTTLSPAAALELDFADSSGRPVGVFDLGARLDVAAGDRTLVFPSAWGGLTLYFDRGRRYGVKTSAGNSFRAPTMSELYYSYGNVTAAPDLKAEKAVSADAAFFFSILDSMELTAGAFWRRDIDAVWFDNSTFRNLPAADFAGAEFSFLGSWLFGRYSAVDLTLNYELNYGRYRSGEPFDLNHRHIFRAAASYGCGEWFRFYLNADVYSGFADIRPFVDLRGGVKGSYKGFFLELGVKNLAGMELRYHNYTSVVPRSWSCAVGWRAARF